jgi:hypothetical protein
MSPQEKYNALAVDPDLDTRMRLKQACTSVITFDKFVPVNSLTEALVKLKGPDRIDVVFLADRFGKEAVSECITEGKKTRWGQDAAFVMLLPAKAQGTGDVVRAMFSDADGMLFEPYSVDMLVEITLLAARVKKERGEERRLSAMRFFLTEVIELITIIAQLQAQGMESGKPRRELRDLCASLDTMSPSDRELYYVMAVEMFEQAKAPAPVISSNYKGASTRIRRKLEEKVIATIKSSD